MRGVVKNVDTPTSEVMVEDKMSTRRQLKYYFKF
jgi:hypothetical protein